MITSIQCYTRRKNERKGREEKNPPFAGSRVAPSEVSWESVQCTIFPSAEYINWVWDTKNQAKSISEPLNTDTYKTGRQFACVGVKEPMYNFLQGNSSVGCMESLERWTAVM